MGKKVIESYTIDGADSLSFFTSKLGDFYLEFKESDRQKPYELLEVYRRIDNVQIGDGTWSFNTFEREIWMSHDK